MHSQSQLTLEQRQAEVARLGANLDQAREAVDKFECLVANLPPAAALPQLTRSHLRHCP